ncbi:hypothetical protein SK803_27000 [Lentzea sp. BCCO 10_0856]|uniref:Lipoprotein n=1 Tax=Lentzea miocenica TaxID=3095431 RepID=A0ABU4T6T5_9PSEU|nr:hypothetical protein [Lentzea sp. BCCO 10_0856]MDX8033886.1 hypothetical protein [Lentzea sp. BCCO 10_0856]
MRTRLLAALLTGAVVLTACGSDADKPITDTQRQWVDAFCGGVLPGLEAGLDLRKQDPANVAAVKAAYVKLVTSNATAFTGAEKKLKELGAPDDELKNVHERLVKFVTESAKSYGDAQAPVQALEPNAQFLESAEKVLADTNVVTSPEDLRATFQELQKRPKYADALGRSAPCSEIRSKGQQLGQ